MKDMTKEQFEELEKWIKKEKDMNCLIESSDDFTLHFSCRPNGEIYPYPKINEVIDEDKSVKWNREEVSRLRERFEKRVEELNKYKNKIIVEYEDRLITLLGKNNNISHDESSKIWSYAYLESHSSGVRDVTSTYEEIADLYNDLFPVSVI